MATSVATITIAIILNVSLDSALHRASNISNPKFWLLGTASIYVGYQNVLAAVLQRTFISAFVITAKSSIKSKIVMSHFAHNPLQYMLTLWVGPSNPYTNGYNGYKACDTFTYKCICLCESWPLWKICICLTNSEPENKKTSWCVQNPKIHSYCVEFAISIMHCIECSRKKSTNIVQFIWKVYRKNPHLKLWNICETFKDYIFQNINENIGNRVVFVENLLWSSFRGKHFKVLYKYPKLGTIGES